MHPRPRLRALVETARAKRGWRRAGAAVLCAASLLGAATLAHQSWRWRVVEKRGGGRTALYREIGAWLRDHAPSGAVVAGPEIGTLAFSSDLRGYDLFGLISPRALPFVRRGDIAGALRDSRADFVPVWRGGYLSPVVEAPWFSRRYREVARFSPGTAIETVLYAKRGREPDF